MMMVMMMAMTIVMTAIDEDLRGGGGGRKVGQGVGMVRRKQLERRGGNIRVKASESTGYS